MVSRLYSAAFVALATTTLLGCGEMPLGNSLAATTPPQTESTEPAAEFGEDMASTEVASTEVTNNGTVGEPSDLTKADFPESETAEPQAAPEVEEPIAGPNLVMANAAAAKVEDLTSRVVALQTEVEDLKATIKALQDTLFSLQRNIASSEDQTAFSERALGAMAEDANLRSSLGEMLQGKVRLVNNTGAEAVVYINGTPWTVVTGDSYIYAPVGTVSFLSKGDTAATFKGVQEWKENPETGQFELTFEIGSSATERSVLRNPAK